MSRLSPDAVLAIKEAAARAMISATDTVQYQTACSESVATMRHSPQYPLPFLLFLSELALMSLDATEESV